MNYLDSEGFYYKAEGNDSLLNAAEEFAKAKIKDYNILVNKRNIAEADYQIYRNSMATGGRGEGGASFTTNELNSKLKKLEGLEISTNAARTLMDNARQKVITLKSQISGQENLLQLEKEKNEADEKKNALEADTQKSISGFANKTKQYAFIALIVGVVSIVGFMVYKTQKKN